MKLKPKNETTRFARRVSRGAANGQIVGFAATCLMRDGSVQNTWFVVPEQFTALGGASFGLAQEVAWYQTQKMNSKGLPIARRERK